jgi:hypothetical protein
MTTQEGDVLLVLHISSIERLEDPTPFVELVKEAAQRTKTYLLIHVPSSFLSLVDPVVHFDAFQRLLSTVYVTASAIFSERGQPLLPVDVVVEAIRRRLHEPPSLVDRKFTTVIESDRDEDTPMTGHKPPEGKLYPCVALGGTFDHLHPGHKILLTAAAWIAQRRMIVGITDAPLLTKKAHRHLLESLSVVLLSLSVLSMTNTMYMLPLQRIPN